jgi:hypothetical protein
MRGPGLLRVLSQGGRRRRLDWSRALLRRQHEPPELRLN